MHKWEYILLAILTLFGLFLRAYGLTDSPESLYQDEASIGYNAYSILQTVRDEHGKFLPIFFESFGDYKLPVYIYLVAFVQLFLGLSDLSVRIPSLILGVLTIPLIYLATRLLLEEQNDGLSKTVPLISAFLLTLSPWHYQFSRPGFEASAGLFSLILAIYLFFKAKKESSIKILLLSSIFFLITLYTYHSAKIIVPILTLILYFLYRNYFQTIHWLIFFGIILISFVHPLLNPEALTRARGVIIFSYYPINQALIQTIENYLKNISFSYLFLEGDPTLAHTSPHRWGLLHIIEFPFLILGLVKIILSKNKEFKFILIYLLVGSIPSAVTILNPHALRSLFGLPSFIFVSALGLGLFLKYLNKKQKIMFLGLYITLIFFSEITFLKTYHKKYLIDAGKDWQVGIKRTAEVISKVEKNFENIYIEENGIGKIAYLWYLKYPPKLYQSSSDKINLGKYHFGYLNEAKNGKNLFITKDCNSQATQIIQVIYYPNKTLAFCIWIL